MDQRTVTKRFQPGDLVELRHTVRKGGRFKRREDRIFLVVSCDSTWGNFLTVVSPAGGKRELNPFFVEKVGENEEGK